MCKTGCIYKHTNILNGKAYIGQTILGLKRRWTGHKSQAKLNKCPTNHFHNAIRKYGEDCWTHEILEDNIPKEVLNEREWYYICKYNTREKGYNTEIFNTENYYKTHSKETILKLIEIRKNRTDKEKALISSKIAKSITGKNNGKFKPWWYQKRDEDKVFMFEISINQFAIENNYNKTTLLYRFKETNQNTFAKKGIFKDIKFGYL